MPTLSDRDLLRFRETLSRLRVNADGCLRMAPNFNTAEQSLRSYQVYWYERTGIWPGRLKKFCTTDGCVIHYKEMGHKLTPDEVEDIKNAADYWGMTSDLAKKYGVSKARISQIRNSQ